jgi:hypothetical protein
LHPSYLFNNRRFNLGKRFFFLHVSFGICAFVDMFRGNLGWIPCLICTEKEEAKYIAIMNNLIPIKPYFFDSLKY